MALAIENTTPGCHPLPLLNKLEKAKIEDMNTGFSELTNIIMHIISD